MSSVILPTSKLILTRLEISRTTLFMKIFVAKKIQQIMAELATNSLCIYKYVDQIVCLYLLHTHTHTHTDTHTHTRMHRHTHTDAQTHTHTHTQTQKHTHLQTKLF